MTRFTSCLCVGTLFLSFTNVLYVDSHSWVECAHYDIDKSISDNSYSESDCSGWIRGWGDYNPTDFGEDHGADYEMQDEPTMCEKTIGSPTNDYASTYDDEYPPPEYYVGETVRLLWPAKNHANYECVEWETDDALQLYVANNNPNPTEDLSKNFSDWTLIIDYFEGVTDRRLITVFGDSSLKSYLGEDDTGFENCPHYCDNTDLAICYQDFVVPDIFPEDGWYTFVWYWEKNVVRHYTSCWEAYVSGTQSNTHTNTDTNSNTNTNTNSNSNSNSDSPTTTEAPNTYNVSIPVCGTGADYDEDTILGALDDLYGDILLSRHVSSEDFVANDANNKFNITIKTETHFPILVSTFISNGSVCNAIEDAYINDLGETSFKCSICDEYVIRKQANNNDDDSNSNTNGNENEQSNASNGNDGTDIDWFWIVILLCFIVIIQCIGLIYCWTKNRKSGGKTSESMANVIAGSNHTASGVVRQKTQDDNSPNSWNGSNASPQIAMNTSAPRPPPPRPPMTY